MKKYKVTWYSGQYDIGHPECIKEVLAETEMEASNIATVSATDILSKYEAKRYKTQIRYCLRISWSSGELTDAKECVIDYGSWSRFIYVREIE